MEDQSMFGEREVSIYLPPGFRFFPTDEEIITSYLSQKVALPYFTARAIGEADLNKCEPWDLPSKAKMGENEWYFFCQNDRKYPTGIRTNRATGSGYWKATGKDREIFKGKKTLIGMKKTLVFYKGRAPNGEKTNWVMHEFRLEGSSFNHHYRRSPKDEWVVSKIFHKNVGLKRDTFGAVTNKNSNYSDPNIASTSSNQHSPLDNSFDLSYLNQDYPSDLWCNNTLLSERNESAGLMMPNRDAYGYLNDVTDHNQWKL